jgi:hypothetical protein
MTTYFESFQLVCQALSVSWTASDIDSLRSRLTHGSLSWEKVVEVVNDYLVGPAFWDGLIQKGLDHSVQGDPRQYFTEVYRLNQDRNGFLKDQLIGVLNAFNSAKLPCVLLKGASQFFQPIHTDSGSRIIGDLDILIKEKDYEAACDALYGLGYQSQVVGYDTDKLHHYAPLFRSGDYASIELHRHAVHLNCLPILPTSRIWEAINYKENQGMGAYVPSISHSILINFLHSQIADRNHALRQFNLRTILDFALIKMGFSESVDSEAIKLTLKKHRLESEYDAYALAANNLLKAPVSKQNGPGLRPRIQHYTCMAAVRWPLIDALVRRLEDFTIEKISKRYACKQNFLSISAFRLLYLANYLRNRYLRSR